MNLTTKQKLAGLLVVVGTVFGINMNMEPDQIILSLLTGGAICLVGHRERKVRRWGQLMGLLGQPFWIYATIQAQQWPIVALSIWTSYSWIMGTWNHWTGEDEDAQKMTCSCGLCGEQAEPA